MSSVHDLMSFLLVAIGLLGMHFLPVIYYRLHELLICFYLFHQRFCVCVYF